MKTVTTIKLDKNTKEKASKLASDMGLSLSSIVNASLKQFIIERRVTFRSEPSLNAKSKKALREALGEIENSKNLIGPFSNIGELKKSLLKK